MNTFSAGINDHELIPTQDRLDAWIETNRPLSAPFKSSIQNRLPSISLHVNCQLKYVTSHAVVIDHRLIHDVGACTFNHHVAMVSITSDVFAAFVAL